MANTELNWRESLAVGSVVVMRSGFGYAKYSLAKVTSITPTQIVIGHSRFRKRDGGLVGGDAWSSLSIEPVTEHRVAQIRADSLAKQLRAVEWSRVPLDILDRVDSIMREHAESARAQSAETP